MRLNNIRITAVFMFDIIEKIYLQYYIESISYVFDLEVASSRLGDTVIFFCKNSILLNSQFFHKLITSHILNFKRDYANYLLSSWISNYFPNESRTLLAFIAESCHFGLYVLRICSSYSSRLIVFRISNPSS